MLRFRSLGSGSSGNATLVEAHQGTGGGVFRLLVDCGLTLRHLDQRLERAGLLASQIDAVFVTHEHSDHIGCALQLALRERTPVWMSRGTWVAIGSPDFEGQLRLAHDGVGIDLGNLHIMPFTVPHDAREPLQLTCTDGDRVLGILTDLGHLTPHVTNYLSVCQTLLLECNHDPQMLTDSRYPPFLKNRVAGRLGHLSNAQAGELVASLNPQVLRRVVAAHLSKQNNRPALAQVALATAMACDTQDITVADAAWGTDWIAI